MPGGAIWTIAASTQAAAAIAERAAAITQTELDVSQQPGPYRPAQWQNPALVTITIPGNDPGMGGRAPVINGSSAALNASGGQVAQAAPDLPGGFLINTATGTNQIVQDTIFVFDAVIRTEHQQRVEKTEHPIQTGANISDHAYIMPARVELEIGMSDAMDSYVPGSWSDNPSKSVSAYQTMVALSKARTPVTLTTRLAVYQNMLLTVIHSPDTVETRFGLKATLVFEELFTGTVTTRQVSARPDLTGQSNPGNRQGLPVPADVLASFQVTAPTTVPNAGTMSSTPVAP
jgi:hypothetical protein